MSSRAGSKLGSFDRATIQLDYRGTIETPKLITGQVVQNFGEGEADEVDTFTMTRIGNLP